jgi:broad specificity phosphatase PhoE
MTTTIEVRRHAMRAPGGVHLVQAGVALARRVGEGLGPFTRVITSPIPRAFETAIAMGFAVDVVDDHLALVPEKVVARVAWDSTFGAWAAAAADGSKPVRTHLGAMRDWLAGVAGDLPDGGAALMVSHGGVIESIAVACIGDGAATWGDPARYVEGVRLTFDRAAGRFIGGTVLRVTDAPPNVH